MDFFPFRPCSRLHRNLSLPRSLCHDVRPPGVAWKPPSLAFSRTRSLSCCHSGIAKPAGRGRQPGCLPGVAYGSQRPPLPRQPPPPLSLPPTSSPSFQGLSGLLLNLAKAFGAEELFSVLFCGRRLVTRSTATAGTAQQGALCHVPPHPLGLCRRRSAFSPACFSGTFARMHLVIATFYCHCVVLAASSRKGAKKRCYTQPAIY